MYYTNISYDEAQESKYNNKIFVWTKDDSEWSSEHYEVTFLEGMGQQVDSTSVFIGIKDLTYISHTN